MRFASLLFSIVVAVATLVGSCSATTPRSEALITELPGLDNLPPFDMYSGYITLKNTTKNIFYWFVTSSGNPSSDPVVMWLQGGPGCSGLGDGLLWENGPFYTTIENATTQEVLLLPSVTSFLTDWRDRIDWTT